MEKPKTEHISFEDFLKLPRSPGHFSINILLPEGLKPRDILINSQWDEIPEVDHLKYVEQKCGSLAYNLAELANIVREVYQGAEAEREAGKRKTHRFLLRIAPRWASPVWLSRKTFKPALRAIASAKKLRPLIEMALNADQAANFYYELLSILSFPELPHPPDPPGVETIYGPEGKGAEGVVRQLEHFQRLLIMNTDTDKGAGITGGASKEAIQNEMPEDNSDLTKAERLAYQSYEYATRKNPELADATDNKVYGWLKENNLSDYELPSCDTWKRQLRAGRKHHGTQKNAPRAGRTSRSIVPVNQIEYTSNQKAD